MLPQSKIVVLDFGSQYAHLIAKRFRSLGYYSEIALPSCDIENIKTAKGIILSGGPSSVYESNIPQFNKSILSLDIPILGLCYGHQLMASEYGGQVEKAKTGEFGIAYLENSDCVKSPLFENISFPMQVWMSHQDEVKKISDSFECIGKTENCNFAALQNIKKKRFSLQFHCEVNDTPEGNTIFENFARLCGIEKNWSEEEVLKNILDDIIIKAENKNVLLFLSGGVDSSVTFALLNKALGQKRVLGLHIDNGFMRKDESKKVEELYHSFGFNNFIVKDASELFLKSIENIIDPQKKRQAIGETFLTVRNKVVSSQNLCENNWLLAQGTLYPDIIESGGTANSKTIKTHHNRVEAIQTLLEKGLIIEPLRNLYKDEVRKLGKQLGLNKELISRHPFPGPGLSINVLCSTGFLNDSDKKDFENALEEIKTIKLNQFIDNYSLSILPVKSVGVQGDFRTYRFPAVISFQNNEKGFYDLSFDWNKIELISSSITNNSKFINRTLIQLYKKQQKELSLQKAFCDKERLDKLREVDNIVLEKLHKHNFYGKIFQHLTIELPFASSEQNASFVLRPVCSEDVMTARFAKLPKELLEEIIIEIAKLDFVDSIFYDATNKPPATFGWE